MAVYHNLQTVFVEVSKNASNAIRRTLANDEVQYSEYSHYKWMLALEQANGNDISEYFKFIITRNPYDRFFSAHTQMQSSMRWPKTVDQTLDWLLEKVNRSTGEPIKVVDDQGNPIPEKVENPLNGQLQYWWDDAPPLLWPQHAFITEGTTVYVDNYYKIEDMSNQWAIIATTINNLSGASLPLELPVVNAQEGLPNWNSYFEGEDGQVLANKIEQLYDRDFELFGYNKLVF